MTEQTMPEIDIEAKIKSEFYEPTDDNQGVICSLTMANGAVLKGGAYGNEPVMADGKVVPSTQNAWANCQAAARAGTVELALSHELYHMQSIGFLERALNQIKTDMAGMTFQLQGDLGSAA